MPAKRNIRLCTKDCLCLFVCPTGATDTEDGQIDASKCLKGCRLCVDACPSHAISLVPDEYPAQQDKSDDVVSSLLYIAESKATQEQIAKSIAKNSDDKLTIQLAEALVMSNRVMGEDIIREAGYMLPQSDNVKALLENLINNPKYSDFPADIAKELLDSISK